MAAKWNPPNFDDIAERYIAGESGVSIAREFGIHSVTLYKHLERAGIPRRSFSAATSLWLAQETRDQQIARLTPAWTARRSSHVPTSTLKRRARTFQTTQTGHISADEVLIKNWLLDEGLQPIPQFAIDRFNIDLALLPIAVEILSDKASPMSRRPDRRKVEYLTNRGTWVLYIWITKRFPADRQAVVSNVIAFREMAQADPSPVGKYRVIRGSGELVAEGRGDFGQLTGVPTLCHANWKRL